MKILEQLRRKDKAAVSQLYDHVYPRLKEDTESAFREALIVVYRQLQNPDFTLPCELEDYIYSIAMYTIKQKPSFKLNDDTINLIAQNERKRVIQERFRKTLKLK